MRMRVRAGVRARIQVCKNMFVEKGSISLHCQNVTSLSLFCCVTPCLANSVVKLTGIKLVVFLGSKIETNEILIFVSLISVLFLLSEIDDYSY